MKTGLILAAIVAILCFAAGYVQDYCDGNGGASGFCQGLHLSSAPPPAPVHVAPHVATQPAEPPAAPPPPRHAETPAPETAAGAGDGDDEDAGPGFETAFILMIAKEFPVGSSSSDLMAQLQARHYMETKAQPPGAPCSDARQFAKRDSSGDRRFVSWCADSLGTITWIGFGGKAKDEATMHVATGLGPPGGASPPEEQEDQPPPPPAPPPVAAAAPPPPPVAPPRPPPPAPEPEPSSDATSPSSSPSSTISISSGAGMTGSGYEAPGQGSGGARHEVTLGAINYKSPTNWTIVLNGQLVSSKMRPRNITVTPTSVTLKVFNSTVTLTPYTAYNLDTHMVVPLNKPK
jgi:hypothetical protein